MYEPLLSFKETQNLLGIGRNSLLNLLNNGIIPACKIAGQWKFKREDLEEFVEYQKFSS